MRGARYEKQFSRFQTAVTWVLRKIESHNSLQLIPTILLYKTNEFVCTYTCEKGSYVSLNEKCDLHPSSRHFFHHTGQLSYQYHPSLKNVL